MRRRGKYQVQASARRRGAIFWVTLALFGAGLLAFIWWRPARAIHAQTSQTSVAVPPSPGISNPSGPAATSAAPVLPARSAGPEPVPAGKAPDHYPRPTQDIFEAQLALGRLGISAGSIDGLNGPQTRAALRAFQKKENLPVTGELDPATRERLFLDAPPLTSYSITSNDLARLQPVSKTWLGKSQQSALDYESIVELLAEKGHAHPSLLRKLNPAIDWTNVIAGMIVQIPFVDSTNLVPRAAFVRIGLAEKTLEAFDAKTNLLVHFPCSIAQKMEKRPVGELHVAVIAPNPNYTLDPDVFPESPEAQQLKTKLILPPGPNNPVGVAWIGLDKPGYGIHGTPSPEQVGRTESHGCFRLANWNAEYLLRLVTIGTPVLVEP